MEKERGEWNFKSELKRKGIHLLSIFFLLAYIFFGEIWGKRIALLLLTLLLILFFELEYFRLKGKRKIPLISGLWREKEKDRLGGQVFFLIGAIIVLAVFDKDIAIAAILMTTFGDMAAALFGMRFGRTWLKKIPDRAWEGIFAELAVDIIIGFIFLENLWIILIMAFTATFVETVFNHADDNLIIPLFAGFNGQILRMLFEYFGALVNSYNHQR